MSLWKSIRQEWPSFLKHLTFEVGDGAKVKFWHDRWCGVLCLKDAYPKLFTISRTRDASMADPMSFRNSLLQCDMTFTRSVQDWELESLSSFLELIYSKTLSGRGDAKLCWGVGLPKEFSVKSYFKCLSPDFAIPFLWKSIWKAKVPPRVLLDCCIRKILTMDNLRKWGFILCFGCCMCKHNGKSVDHLLLHCFVAQELWSLVCLGCNGSCLVVFRIFWSAGRGVSGDIDVLGFGGLFLTV